MNQKDSRELRSQVLKRDSHTCQQCFSIDKKLEVHHIIPTRRNGINSMNNLITLCVPCHRRLESHGRGKTSNTEFNGHFVAKHVRQGSDRIIIIVPKDHRDSVNKLRNPMLVTVEEIL